MILGCSEIDHNTLDYKEKVFILCSYGNQIKGIQYIKLQYPNDKCFRKSDTKGKVGVPGIQVVQFLPDN
jgi:hypothetical protein